MTKKHETLHIGCVGLKGIDFGDDCHYDNNMVERLHNTIRDWEKVTRGLDQENSVFMKCHHLYYNFISPHMALENKTHAEIADIHNDGNNKWLTLVKAYTMPMKGYILEYKAN